MEAATEWLRSCRSGHEACRTDRVHSMPKRLLKIHHGGKTISLVRPLDRTPYVVLSYCWGGDQRSKTTKPTLQLHNRQIHIESLSQSVQDAIKATAALGVAHLWIDALRIVQDDPHEIMEETANMPDVYQRGLVTILAGDSDTAQKGFLHKREPIAQYSISVLPNVDEANVCSVTLEPRLAQT